MRHASYSIAPDRTFTFFPIIFLQICNTFIVKGILLSNQKRRSAVQRVKTDCTVSCKQTNIRQNSWRAIYISNQDILGISKSETVITNFLYYKNKEIRHFNKMKRKLQFKGLQKNWNKEPTVNITRSLLKRNFDMDHQVT
jgi:hypothetical protein